MRITVEFVTDDGRLTLPLHYNGEIQGLIYRHLDWAISSRLHDEGISFGKRQFRFFTFSRIVGKYCIAGKQIEFTGPAQIHIGSVHEEILESLVKHLLTSGVILLGEKQCELLRVEVEEKPKINGPVRVKTLSPITTYSTLTTGDDRKKTYYYSPTEHDWEIQLLANLWRKSQALGWDQKDPKGLDGARIKPIRVGKKDVRIVKYKGTVIKGWTGIYELDLPEPFFNLAYDAGLGSKNSQGFGMLKVIQ